MQRAVRANKGSRLTCGRAGGPLLGLRFRPPLELGDDRPREHQEAADREPPGEGLPQDEHPAYAGEEGLHRHEDRGVGGVGRPLPEDLEGEGDAAGHDTAVEDGDGRGERAGEGRGLEEEGGGEAVGRADGELPRGELDGVDAVDQVGQDEDVEGPEEGAREDEEVALGHREARAHAEDV